MSLPLASILSVPERTAEIAHAAFSEGTHGFIHRIVTFASERRGTNSNFQ